jgi:hypothetical protein
MLNEIQVEYWHDKARNQSVLAGTGKLLLDPRAKFAGQLNVRDHDVGSHVASHDGAGQQCPKLVSPEVQSHLRV